MKRLLWLSNSVIGELDEKNWFGKAIANNRTYCKGLSDGKYLILRWSFLINYDLSKFLMELQETLLLRIWEN